MHHPGWAEDEDLATGVLILLVTLSALQELQLDSDPGVWRAALETLNILDTCSQQRLLASPEGIS